MVIKRVHGINCQHYANKNNLQLTGYAYEVGLNDFVISDEADYITKIVIKIQEIS